MYDYIVVGAGSAGAPLAARLSEHPALRVPLLEAGPDYPSAAETPPDLLDSRNLAGIEHDWQYVASPVAGRTIPYRRGKVVGGCSAMNAGAAMWGRPVGFAEWVEIGNPEWAWDSVYFQRLESDRDAPGPLHGTEGPLPICRYPEAELIPIQRAFQEACRSQGFADVVDHNDPRHSGVGLSPMNRDATTRISTSLGYLSAARGRPNLTIQPKSPAVQPRIELDFCAEREELRRLMAGIRLAWWIATSVPIAQETERIVGLTEDIVRSDELLAAYVLDNVGTYCHALGTARMGPDHDPGAVVDQILLRSRDRQSVGRGRLGDPHGPARDHQPHRHRDRGTGRRLAPSQRYLSTRSASVAPGLRLCRPSDLARQPRARRRRTAVPPGPRDARK